MSSLRETAYMAILKFYQEKKNNIVFTVKFLNCFGQQSSRLCSVERCSSIDNLWQQWRAQLLESLESVVELRFSYEN